jgi:hypothetical protein
MSFIASVPAEYYYFLVPDDHSIYGMFISEEVVEYFINEFPLQAFEIVRPEEIRKVMQIKGCKIWGNKELLAL